MNSKSRTGAFILSTIFHLAILALMIFGVLFKPSKKPVPMIFEMVSPPSVGELPDIAEGAVIEFTPQEIEPIPEPIAEPIQEPVPVPPKPPKEVKPKPPVPPKPKTLSYEEFIRKNPVKQQKVRKPRPKTVTAPKIDTSAINDLKDLWKNSTTTGQLSAAEQSAIERYLARVVAIVKQTWQKPSGLGPNLKCIVLFDISASGRLLSPRISSSSGNSEFDASALSAVRDARGLGPTPDSRSHPYGIRFNISDGVY